MITFSNLGKHGRLGNVLFQFAFIKCVSLYRGYELVLPSDIDEVSHHGQKCVLKHFQASYNKLSEAEISNAIIHEVTEPWEYRNSFVKEFLEVPDNTSFVSGYFQNYNYIRPIESEIRKEFRLCEDIDDPANAMMADIKNDNRGHEIVSIHIRRGDQIGHWQDYDILFGEGGSLSPDCRYRNYLSSAIDKVGGKPMFVVFTGGSRTNDDDDDKSWCLDEFTRMGIPFIMSPATSAMSDFALMSKCDHNIMSPISTFGWWASFLNTNKNKVICYPNIAPSLTPNSKPAPNYYPDNFLKLDI